MGFRRYNSHNSRVTKQLVTMSERFLYGLVRQRVAMSLEACLREESAESNEAIADVVRSCLYLGLTERQRLRRKTAHKETPLQLQNSR